MSPHSSHKVICGDPQNSSFPLIVGPFLESIFKNCEVELEAVHHGSFAVLVPGMHAETV